MEFAYEGVDKSGKKVSGRMEVPGEGDLRMALRQLGIRPTRITKPTALQHQVEKVFKPGLGGVPVEDVVTFTRQLQLLISSGVPLMQGLELLAEQTGNANMRGIITQVRDKVGQGAYLWESIAGYPNVFPRLYVALIRAGEASGALDQMLRRLVKYLEDNDRTRRMVKSAMMYPIIVTSIGAGVVALLLIFVIPKFEEMLKSGGQELPAITQFVIDASNFLVHNILFILGGLTALVVFGGKYLKSPEGRAVTDRILFRAPIFGNLMQKAGVARFARTLQTLLQSGVNVLDAVEICRATIDNAVLEAAVVKIRAEIEAGKTLGATLSRMPVFPRIAVQMIMVGEGTGNIDKMLEKIADYYEQEVEIMVGGMSKLMEPIILVFLGGTVGGLMIAMYLPIFKLAGSSGP